MTGSPRSSAPRMKPTMTVEPDGCRAKFPENDTVLRATGGLARAVCEDAAVVELRVAAHITLGIMLL